MTTAGALPARFCSRGFIRALASVQIALVVLGGCGHNGTERPPHFVVAGQVQESDARFSNDRLVLLFLNGQEVARAVTARGEFPWPGTWIEPWRRFSCFRQEPGSSDGIQDGLFILVAENSYGLTGNLLRRDGLQVDLGIGPSESPFKVYGHQHFVSTWVGALEHNGTHKMTIPSKRIDLTVKVIQGKASELPAELVDATGGARLEEGKIFIDRNQHPEGEEEEASLPSGGIRYEPETELEPLKTITVPINNCFGNSVLTQEYRQEQTFIHEFERTTRAGIALHIPLGSWLRIVPELQTQFGYRDGEINTRSITYQMSAQPGTRVLYTIVLSEVWRRGNADFFSGDAVVSMPFRTKEDVVYEIKSTQVSCDL